MLSGSDSEGQRFPDLHVKYQNFFFLKNWGLAFGDQLLILPSKDSNNKNTVAETTDQAALIISFKEGHF